MMPCGSSACLMARIIDSATGDWYFSSLSALSSPTPCSAENEPPNSATASYTSWCDALFVVTQEGLGVALHRCLHVVVQVAIAQVAEVDQAHAGNLALQHRIGVRHKGGDARDLHRDVVLDVQALFGLGQRNALADVPELVRLREVFGHHGIGHAAGLKRFFEQRFEACAGVFFGFAVGIFEQHAPGRIVLAQEGHAQLRHVLAHQAQRKLAHHLKARQACAELLVRHAQQLHGVSPWKARRPRR